MKIFFDASLTGKREYGDNYVKIAETIEHLGHELIKSSLFSRSPEDISKETSEDADMWYKNLKKWAVSCDVAIIEVSYPSIGIGHEISLLLQLGKPVVALYVKDREPKVLETIPTERLQVLEYDTTKVKSTIDDAIKYAADMMDTRFNFFISPKIGSYLDWVSRNKRIPRAVFLRDLITKDMSKQGYRDISE